MKNTFLKKCLQRSVLVALAAFALVSNRAEATALTWDPLLSTTGGTDGAGTWDTTTANWYNGTTTLSTWVPADYADFGTAATGGAVNVSTGLSAAGLGFTKSGYVLSGNTLTLTSATNSNGLNVASVYVNSGVSAEIDDNLILGTSATGISAYFGANSGASLTLTGNVTTANAFSSIIFNGLGTYNLTGGTYTSNGFFTVGTLTATGTTAITAYELKVGFDGNSTTTVNGAGTSLTTTGNYVDEIGIGGGVGTLDLKAGTVSLGNHVATTSLDLTFDSNAASQGNLKVEGGAMTVLGTGGIIVNYGGTSAGQSASITVSGGTLTAPVIQFGAGSTAYNATATGSLAVSGGTLYVGSGGIVESTNHAVDTITLSGGTVGATAAWTSAMNMTLSGGATFQSANATGTAFNIGLSGNLGGAGSLTKTGTGTLTLSGADSYTGGTFVTVGSLIVGTTTALQNATGNLTVQGGTLSSSVSNTTLGSNLGLTSGAITPGSTGTAAILTLAAGKNFTMSGGSLTLDLGASTLASDQIVASGAGTFTITGGTLNLNLLSGFAYSTSYAVLSGFASGGVSSLAITGYDTTDYTASLSNSGLLTFAAVPEPSTWALMAGGLGLLVLLQRRKSRISSL